jgi:hypothetical protein
MRYAYAVVYSHPVFTVLLFLPLFFAHDFGELSRCILGELQELAIVRWGGVAESDLPNSSRPKSHFE